MAAAAGPTGSARIGVDVGGTKCLGVAIDPDGNVLNTEQRPTRQAFDELVAVIAETVDAIDQSVGQPWGSGTRAAVGVGLPGLIDRDGRMHATPHLADPGTGAIEARHMLAQALQRPVAVDNDATCAALAESTVGAGRGFDHLIMITLGSGIGGAVILDGELRRGAHGFAGEFGHMLVDPDGPPCPCGRRGCWERYASGQGLQALGRAAADAGQLDRVLAAVGGDPAAVTGEAIEAAARSGDRQSISVLDEFADWIAVGLSNLTNAYDPQVFVLGGGLADMEDLLGAAVARHLAGRLYSSHLRPRPQIRFAALGRSAGAVGAALITSRVSRQTSPR